jgi:methyl-accepting chemotaxis protein
MVNLNDMSLKAKIGTGFAVLLIMAISLGGLSIWYMATVKDQLERLASEYVPEVNLAKNIENHQLLAMYNIRGYAFSGDKNLLKEGRKHLERVKDNLARARDLADKTPSLPRLREGVVKLQQKQTEFERLVNETEPKNDALDTIRKTFDSRAGTIIEQYQDLLKNQQGYMFKELQADLETSKLEERLQKIILITDLIILVDGMRVVNLKFQLHNDLKYYDEVLKAFDTIDKKMAAVIPLVHLQINQKKIDDIQKASQEYKQAMLDFKNQVAALQNIRVEWEKGTFELLTTIQEISQTGIERILTATKLSLAEFGNATKGIIIGLVIAVILGLFMAVSITGKISQAVTKLIAATRQMGEGDLTVQVVADSKDEIGTLASAFKETARSVREIIKKLIDGTARLSLSSAEIAATIEQISCGAKAQSTQILKTSSAMEEMSSSIQEVSRHAASTSNSAIATSNIAREGFQKVKRTVEGINTSNDTIMKLHRRTQEIGKVVQLIGEIAAQTNILALNAAIEAARAGEHGRGFDVVAEEIRKLAQRTSQSTTEISASIEEIQRETEEAVRIMEASTKMANETGQPLEEILDGITSTADMVRMISSTAAQQAKSAGEIADAFQTIAGVSKQTAQASQESARTTQDLTNLTEQLKEITEKFRV